MNMTSSKKEEIIHVITSVERQRRWTAHEKKAIVEETYEAGKGVSYVARKYKIWPYSSSAIISLTI